jgi:hypothetical protein
VIVCEYAPPTFPSGSDEAFNVSFVGATVIDSAFCAVIPAPSVTSTLNEKLPELVGVPASTPPALTEKPGIPDPAANRQSYGGTPPVADNVSE